MDTNKIKEWLDGNGDYQSGLTLFSQHSRNRNVIHYLSRREDMLKLRYEMSKLIRAATPVRSLDAAHSTLTRDILPRERKLNPEQLPEPLKATYESTLESYHKARKSHTLMKEAKTDKERLSHRNELLTHIEENRHGWAVIDQWLEKGELPQVTPTERTTAQFNAAAANLSRTLKAIETADAQKALSLKDKAREYMAILTEGGRQFKETTLAKLKEFGLIE